MSLLSDSAPIGLLPRRLAWDVLQAVAAGAYADVALERVLRERDLKPSDRGLVTELAYGAIRQRRTLDAWLDRLGKVPAEKQPPKLRWLLHVGLYQLLLMERIPDSAAVNTAVELAKTSKGLARLAPVVNGVLRAALRAREAGETLLIAQRFAGSARPGPFPAGLVHPVVDRVARCGGGRGGGQRLQPRTGSGFAGEPVAIEPCAGAEGSGRGWHQQLSPSLVVPMACASQATAAICATGLVMPRAIGVCRIVRRNRLHLCSIPSREIASWMPVRLRGAKPPIWRSWWEIRRRSGLWTVQPDG